MNPIYQYNENIAKSLIKNLEKRRFEAYYCPDKKAALEKTLELIPKGATVSNGGSESIKQIGLLDAIKKGNYQYIDRKHGDNEEEIEKSLIASTFCDYYLMSSNAITKNGELINIDSYGHRVAALSLGSKNIIVVIGMNKLCEDVENGIWRTQNIASPKNTLRINRKTPCSITGVCGDCYGDESICSSILITRRSRKASRIKIILVGEELGY